MNNIKKSIIIKIENDLDEKNCDQKIISKLKMLYYFQYDNKTLIRELYTFLYKKLEMNWVPTEDELIERFCFVINERMIYANLNYKLIDFLSKNNLDNNIILFF